MVTKNDQADEREGKAGLRPYEFSVSGKSLRWYLKSDVDALLTQQAAPEALIRKDHHIRELVNDLRAIAVSYHDTEQLRARISDRVGRFLAIPVAAPEAPTLCQWPTCQSEAVQQQVAKEVHDELYGAVPEAPATGQPIRPLRNASDHAAALAEVQKLMLMDLECGSPESDRLEVLATLVEAYELQHFPMLPAVQATLPDGWKMAAAATTASASGRTNAADETGGTVKRFAFDCSGSTPEIIPATNGAFVWYDDYVKLFKDRATAPSRNAAELLAEIQAALDSLADTKMTTHTYSSMANVLHHCRDAITGKGYFGAALTQQSAAQALPPPELTWLYTHCKAIGMNCKSDSGKWEHDIALFTTNLVDAAQAAHAGAASEPILWALVNLNNRVVFSHESRATVEHNQPYIRTPTWVVGLCADQLAATEKKEQK